MSRPVPHRTAKAMGRPKGRAYLVTIGPESYEVVDHPGGGRKVFRLELVTVETGSAEYERVVDVVAKARAK